MSIYVDNFSPLMIVIEKEDVLSGNIKPYIDIFNKLMSSKQTMLRFYENVDVSINGYNDTSEELFEITEVREFIHKLDAQFPFWLFFLSKNYLGLEMIGSCFLMPHLTDEAKAKYHGKQLMKLLTDRWFLAMNQIFDYLELSNEENEKITERVISYFFKQ